MSSLFAKILLWFLATAVLTITAVVATSLATSTPDRQFPLMRAQIREARFVYENNGKDALADSLKRFKAATQLDMIVTDAEGKDLVTGQDRSEMVRQAPDRRRPRSALFPLFALFPRNQPMIARPSQDGKYWFFVIPPKRNTFLWIFEWQHIVIFVMAVLLCYGLAYYLTSPVRGLQRAVEQFGKGDLSARAPAGRRDELGKLARTFNQMADRIQTLVTAERRLLMDISHELRSPLARLGVAIELARGGADTDASLDRIQKEGDRLNELVGELLEVTRAEGDPAQRKHELIRIDELLAEIVEDSELEASAAGSALKLAVGGQATVEGDPELLRRAIENVIRNAIRYSPAGEPIEVGLIIADGLARIIMRDHGPGVPEEALALLFEPFYRVDSHRNRESGGVGLGLSIARRAVELHRGVIRAKNAQPGLCVEIELPVAPGKIANAIRPKTEAVRS